VVYIYRYPTLSITPPLYEQRRRAGRVFSNTIRIWAMALYNKRVTVYCSYINKLLLYIIVRGTMAGVSVCAAHCRFRRRRYYYYYYNNILSSRVVVVGIYYSRFIPRAVCTFENRWPIYPPTRLYIPYPCKRTNIINYIRAICARRKTV